MLLVKRPKTVGPIICSIIVAQLAMNSLQADCPVTPSALGNGVIEEQVTCTGFHGGNAAVGFDGLGRFVIAWEEPRPNPPSGTAPKDILARRFDAAGDDLEEAFSLTYQIDNNHIHKEVSVDVSLAGVVQLAWLGHVPSMIVIGNYTLAQSAFDFDEDDPIPQMSASSANRGDAEPSAAAAGAIGGITWARNTEVESIDPGL